MAEIERMTITLPAEMAAVVNGAVEIGVYATTSEIVREALRDWQTDRIPQLDALAALKGNIDRGLADVAEADLADIWSNLATVASEATATRFVHALEITLEPLRHSLRRAPARSTLRPGCAITRPAGRTRPAFDAMIPIDSRKEY